MCSSRLKREYEAAMHQSISHQHPPAARALLRSRKRWTASGCSACHASEEVVPVGSKIVWCTSLLFYLCETLKVGYGKTASVLALIALSRPTSPVKPPTEQNSRIPSRAVANGGLRCLFVSTRVYSCLVSRVELLTAQLLWTMGLALVLVNFLQVPHLCWFRPTCPEQHED